jgi:lysine decarboxylase
MASLDVNADILEKHGGQLMAEWRDNIDRFYREASRRVPGLRIMKHPTLDRTKINLDMSGYGLSGHDLEQALMARGIWPELVTGDIVMCMTGIGNQWSDYEALLAALSDIVAAVPPVGAAPAGGRAAWSFPVLEQRAVPKDRIESPLDDASGRVCARALIPYPPGIPIVCPGEVLTEEICRYVAKLRAQGENVIGLSVEGTVCVGKE